jgi:uncharacterized protein (TIGR03032 family)
MPQADATIGPGPEAVIHCDASESFSDWMGRAGAAIAITTYQAGKLVLVGWDGRRVTVLPRTFDRPMGLSIAGRRLALATRLDLCIFADCPALARDYRPDQPGRYEALYLPRVSYHTGDLNSHDVGFGAEGIWIVATRFSCLALAEADYNFRPRWRPPFISEIVPEDRCHLNGMAMVEGRPRFVTALGRSDVVAGWRPRKLDGGLVLDVDSGEVVLAGLCMPHSPRWHAGALWVLNSGAGELWKIDPRDGRHEIIATLPGYARGLGFLGPYALVGLGKIRQSRIVGGLPVERRHPRLICGLAVVDVRTGAQQGTFEFTSGCFELYDVTALPGVRRPLILNLAHEAAQQAFSAPEFAYWLRPEPPREAEPAGPASP